MVSDRSNLQQAALDKFRGEPTWVFMLGVNNSGTTLFLNLMEAHPSVGSLEEEGQYCTQALRTPESLGIPRMWTHDMKEFRWIENEYPGRALRAFYDWTSEFPSDVSILFEKSPTNTIRSRWLQSHFEPASFIATCRHPYAVCEGMRRRAGYSIEECARHWTDANRILISDIPSLNHVFWYKYEEFCADPENVLRNVKSFLELNRPFPKDVIETTGSHSIDGQTKGIQNMNGRSIKRLSESDIRIIDDIAGPVMERIGYKRLQDRESGLL
jgi:hypothetical protein